MKIRLRGSQGKGLRGPNTLRDLIPEGLDGEVLNYGQGEGQVRIGATVWGFYSDGPSDYCFVFEEGRLDLAEISRMALGILGRIHLHWSPLIRGEIEGTWEHDPTMWELKPPHRKEK